MKYSNPRIERLRQLLDLEEQRADLQQQLDSLTQRMHTLRDSLFDEGSASAAPAETKPAARRGRPPAVRSAAPAPEAAAPAGRGGRRRRAKRGALKDQIVAALQSAGQAGIRVTELAKALSIKPVNIHSWFHSALSRYPEIKKIQGGHYRLEDGSGRLTASAAEPATPSASKARKSPGRPARSAAKKSASSPKTGASRSPRGQLSSRILEELEGAGAKGINVKELSAKIDVPYKNIYVWFATTGKKNAKVKKVGPAQYRLG